MKWGFAVAILALGAAACWQTKPNSRYCEEPGAVCDGSVPLDGSVTDMVTRCATSSCSGANSICDPESGQCRACTASDCTGSVCDTITTDPGFGQCVACVDDTTCSGKVCKNNQCVPCAKHSDCASTTGICDIDMGTCAPQASVLYVNNASASCSDTEHASSSTMPYCQIGGALNSITDTTDRFFVSVVGNGTSAAATYQALSWTGGPINVAIVGPGKDVDVQAQAFVESVGSSSVSLSGNGMGTTIIIDGLVMHGLSNPGVQCAPTSNVPTLTIRNALIENSDGTGVDSAKCALTLQQSILTGNHGAVSVTAGTYDMENNFIVGNVAPASGSAIAVGGATSGIFRYNTVSANASAVGSVTGVDCGSGEPTNKSVDASIVVQNSGSTSQFSSACIVSATTITDVSTHQPTFKMTTTTDYHLSTSAGENECCIDAIPTGSDFAGTDLVIAYDIDDDKRPLGNGYDIGADEAE